jgi:hypothetical protein
MLLIIGVLTKVLITKWEVENTTTVMTFFNPNWKNGKTLNWRR